MANILSFVNSPLLRTSFLAKPVIDQNKNKIVNALDNAESEFTIIAICSGEGANKVKNFAKIKKKGAPGGCPTCNLNDAAINSPQSQKLAVGSIVARYTIAATIHTSQPIIKFNLL